MGKQSNNMKTNEIYQLKLKPSCSLHPVWKQAFTIKNLSGIVLSVTFTLDLKLKEL